jgi:hypothetical protein
MQPNGYGFENSLSDAIRWCNWVLAHSRFQPDEHTASLDRLDDLYKWRAEFKSNVKRLVKLRNDKLKQAPRIARTPSNWPGMILAFYPGDSIHDGLAQSESGGLFDGHSCPIYDFWIGITGQNRESLLSWIPLPIKPYVDRAIQVDAMKCLAWLGQDEREANL